MEIENVASNEFERLYQQVRRPPSPLAMRMRQLEIGEAVRARCTWRHSKGCHGAIMLRSVASRYGIRIRTTCGDGYLYVQRVA